MSRSILFCPINYTLYPAELHLFFLKPHSISSESPPVPDKGDVGVGGFRGFSGQKTQNYGKPEK